MHNYKILTSRKIKHVRRLEPIARKTKITSFSALVVTLALVLSINPALSAASPSGDSIQVSKNVIALGESVSVTATISDTDGDLVYHDLYKYPPGGPMLSRGQDITGWTNNSNTPGTPSSGNHSVLTATFTPTTTGTWMLHTNGADTNNNWGSAAAHQYITVGTNVAPTAAAPTVQLLRLNDQGQLALVSTFSDTTPRVGDIARVAAVASDANHNLTVHNILVNRPSLVGESTNLETSFHSGSDPASAYVDIFTHTISHYATTAASDWSQNWGLPRTTSMTGSPGIPSGIDVGITAPMFLNLDTNGVEQSNRTFDFVLDATGNWSFVNTAVDKQGLSVVSSVTTIEGVSHVPMPTTVPTTGRFYRQNGATKQVGVYYTSGQAHGIFPLQGGWVEKWRRHTGFYFGGWGAHEVYPMVSAEASGTSMFTHDNYTPAYHRKTAKRLMEVGVDFVIFDHTNISASAFSATNKVIAAAKNAKIGFQDAEYAGRRVKMTMMFGIGSQWSNGFKNPVGGQPAWNGMTYADRLAYFKAHLDALYDSGLTSSPSVWLYDPTNQKPFLFLYTGQEGPWLSTTDSDQMLPPNSASPSDSDDGEGKLKPGYLDDLKLSNGTEISSIFSVKYVGSILSNNTLEPLTGNKAKYTNVVTSTGKHYIKTGHWTYLDEDENLLGTAATIPTPSTSEPTQYESVTVSPRFANPSNGNSERDPVKFRNAILAAKARSPKYLMILGWNEFGHPYSDEKSPLNSWTVADNNKFGDAYVRILKAALADYYD